MNSCVDEPHVFLAELLAWLGRSESPLVVPWLEDLWLENCGVNLPGTRSSDRPNWQRPMSRLLDEIFMDAQVADLLGRLDQARRQ
jgi:4-alpha-glucanotransferase